MRDIFFFRALKLMYYLRAVEFACTFFSDAQISIATSPWDLLDLNTLPSTPEINCRELSLEVGSARNTSTFWIFPDDHCMVGAFCGRADNDVVLPWNRVQQPSYRPEPPSHCHTRRGRWYASENRTRKAIEERQIGKICDIRPNTKNGV